METDFLYVLHRGGSILLHPPRGDCLAFRQRRKKYVYLTAGAAKAQASDEDSVETYVPLSAVVKAGMSLGVKFGGAGDLGTELIERILNPKA